MEDIKVVQDLKIFQQIIRKCADGKNTIVVVYVGNITVNERNGNGGIEVSGQFDFASFLDALPQPRLLSLKREAIRIAKDKHRSDTRAGNYLGGTRRLVNHEKQKIDREEMEQ